MTNTSDTKCSETHPKTFQSTLFIKGMAIASMMLFSSIFFLLIMNLFLFIPAFGYLTFPLIIINIVYMVLYLPTSFFISEDIFDRMEKREIDINLSPPTILLIGIMFSVLFWFLFVILTNGVFPLFYYILSYLFFYFICAFGAGVVFDREMMSELMKKLHTSKLLKKYWRF